MLEHPVSAGGIIASGQPTGDGRRADPGRIAEWTAEYSHFVVQALPEATVLVIGPDETVWFAEGRLLGRDGTPPHLLPGRPMAEILPDATRAQLSARYHAALTGEHQSFDYRTVDGRAICWIQLSPLYAGQSTAVAVLAVVQDLTERHAREEHLRAERERRKLAEEIAGLGHWEVDLERATVTLSEGALRLLGDCLEKPSETSLEEMLSRFADGDRATVKEALLAADRAGAAECECDLLLPDGRARRVLMRGLRGVDGGGRSVITGATIDITELRAAERARSESEVLLARGFDSSPVGMALCDPLTGRFTRVNDALCRLFGRRRETMLGLSFAELAHPEDLPASGDGPELLLSDAAGQSEAERRFVRPDGSTVWCSLHVVPIEEDDNTVRALFAQVVDRSADKQRELELMQEAADLELLAALRSALAEDRLLLHAQPIISLADDDVVQQELLVRLRGENGELIAPGLFLPVAERYGYIREIDRWVSRQAIRLAASGQPVEVNLSGASVGDPELLAVIRSTLLETGADPSRIIFEVTETALIADVERGREFVLALRELGCRFALDDFGTGYGTFTYLKHIPIDYVKIDIDFVRDMRRSVSDERLVAAIVMMARELGKQTVAEGVEDAETLERLRALGVDQAQGYFIGRPGPLA